MPLTIFESTVLRQTDNGDWYIMNKQQGGWASHAHGPYLTLDDVCAAWAVYIGGAGEDKHSTFRHVAPATGTNGANVAAGDVAVVVEAP